jgi:hypothetical protein
MVVYKNNQLWSMVVYTQSPIENFPNFVEFASQAAMEATEKAEFNLSMEEAAPAVTGVSDVSVSSERLVSRGDKVVIPRQS